MKAILKKFNINEKLTKPRLKQKQFNEIQYNVPMIEDYNFMADLLHLPTTYEGYKYLLVVVDLASKEFDIQPMKTTDSKSTVTAIEKMFKRSYIKKPHSSIQVDGGAEFNKWFTQWCRSNDILLKRTIPYRHKQNSMVESLNKQLGRLFNGYMNMMEQKEKETYREWTDILDDVRKELNKFRKREMPKNVSDYDYPFFDQTIVPRFKVGDWVHYRLDYPRDALGKKQPTPEFRTGDYRYSHKPVQITQVIQMNTEPYYRFMLNGIKNASYSEYDLLKTYRGQKKKKNNPVADDDDDIDDNNDDDKKPKPKTDIKPVVDKKEKSTNKKLINNEKTVSKITVEEPTRRSTRNIKPNQKYLDV
ncbi:MAG: Maverick-related virus strain Spezl [Pseudomonadota bacterium]|jgi:hypothetical protein